METKDRIEFVESMLSRAESLAARCSKRLLKRTELQDELAELRGNLEAALEKDSDPYRVFDRLLKERDTAWRLGDTEYVQPFHCRHADDLVRIVRAVLVELAPDALQMHGRNQIFIAPGEAFLAKYQFFSLMQRARTQLDIVDSYLDETLLPFIESLDPSLAIRLLTHDKKPAFGPLVTALKQVRPILSARKSLEFHDRFIIIDGVEAWHLGTSFNHLGEKVCMLNRVTDPEALAKVISEFEQDWAGAESIQ